MSHELRQTYVVGENTIKEPGMPTWVHAYLCTYVGAFKGLDQLFVPERLYRAPEVAFPEALVRAQMNPYEWPWKGLWTCHVFEGFLGVVPRPRLAGEVMRSLCSPPLLQVFAQTQG